MSVNTTIFMNRYRKSFLTSTNSINASSRSTGLTDDAFPLKHAFDYQDPTIVGFRIRFYFNEQDNLEDLDNLPNSLLMGKDQMYSAYNYLKNINEPERAEYVLKFRSLLYSLQEDTPWYFQSISGLDTLQKIDATKGARTSQDAVITLDMLESIDQRVTMLIYLYRKFAWDSTYQRWMLPENMRWFKVEIVIAEFRDFHMSPSALSDMAVNGDVPEVGSNVFGGIMQQALQQSSTAGRVKNIINKGKDIVDRVGGIINPKEDHTNFSENMTFPDVNELLPMHVLVCDMCEFDFLNRNDPWAATISSSESGEDIKQEIKFKVGRVIEQSDFSPATLLFRDDNIRNQSQSLNLQIGTEKLERMGASSIGITRSHNSSNTNYLKDRIKSVATTIVGEAVDRFTESLFMGKAFDGKTENANFNNHMEVARQALQKKIEFDLTNAVSQLSGNVELVEPAVQHNVPNIDMIPDETVNTNPGNQHVDLTTTITQQQIANTNIGFDIPTMNVETLGNIGF